MPRPPSKPPLGEGARAARLAQLLDRKGRPAPPAEPVSRPFSEEAPTRPTGIQARCAILVANFKLLPPEDQEWIEQVVAMMAWAREP